jgi:hypothetical protein
MFLNTRSQWYLYLYLPIRAWSAIVKGLDLSGPEKQFLQLDSPALQA